VKIRCAIKSRRKGVGDPHRRGARTARLAARAPHAVFERVERARPAVGRRRNLRSQGGQAGRRVMVRVRAN
jgi:hypothetical protein